ncbi:MAG TPA: gliding motility protein GldL [Flavobacteriales bacterium]|nr:gliding motility protein GldL [Flavobacteriales bacterium]
MKKLFHMAYSIGASIVILGALGKILHMSILGIPGDVLLMIGLGTEAVIFFVSAFEPQEEELDWSLVYPELAGGAPRKRKDNTEAELEARLSEKLDNMLKEAELDADLMKSLGESINKLHEAAKSMDVATEAADSTKKFSEELNMAATQLETLNSLYKVQLESVNKNAVANEEVAAYADELKQNMAKLKENLANLNNVYGGMLSAMNVKQ